MLIAMLPPEFLPGKLSDGPSHGEQRELAFLRLLTRTAVNRCGAATRRGRDTAGTWCRAGEAGPGWSGPVRVVAAVFRARSGYRRSMILLSLAKPSSSSTTCRTSPNLYCRLRQNSRSTVRWKACFLTPPQHLTSFYVYCSDTKASSARSS